MGEVYRARDTKLKRDVAIKTLPDEFSHDPDRLSRFQREAEVLASLNHPNIAAIYDLQEADGARFLVLELVEGETLAERLQRGPIPIDEALQIAKSICEALEAAHEQGIVHRDLKPANVKITSDGNVKVLDFGLAKALQERQLSNLSHSPTLLSAASMPGVILGTAAYMSPEQAKGRPVDRRTDIFALGCVLYEMLTGRQAFTGDDAAQILARVLERDPDWSVLPARLSPRIRELLHDCLQKDVRRRRRDAADVRIDIDRASTQPVEIAAAAPLGSSSHRIWVGLVVLFLAGMLALAVPAIRYFHPTAAIPEMRVEINTPGSSVPFEFALSRDGMRLAFVADDNGAQRLWVRQLNSVGAHSLPGTDGADWPFWSPDSRSIGFFANGRLKRIDIDGGAPQILADAASARGGTWNQDGVILFSANTTAPLSRIPATGGTPEVVTHLEQGQGSHRFPQFLPDGHHFLFEYFLVSSDRSGIYIGSLDDTSIKRLLTASDTNALWAPPGWLLFMQQGTLRAQALDISRGALTGNPVTVADSVSFDGSNSSWGGFSASATGMVAYRSSAGSRTQLTWFDRTGKMQGRVGEPDENSLSFPEVSPDGRRVAVTRTVQGNADVWLLDVLRGTATRFTFDAALDTRPLWSLDGTLIVFNSNRKNNLDLYSKPSSGAGVEQLLIDSPNIKVPYSWSADGHFLLYGEDSPKTGYDLWALPMQGDRKPIPVVNSPFPERDGQFSPDGRWVAYDSNESGRSEIYVVPFPPGGGKWQVSTAGGAMPRWRHDGKELFFISPDTQMMAASVSTSGTSFEATQPIALFQAHTIVGGPNTNNKHQYAVSADGRFLINVAADPTIAPITLILNWQPSKP
jgi:Tol biopolymer transport system component